MTQHFSTKEIHQIAFACFYKGLEIFAPDKEELEKINDYLPSELNTALHPKNIEDILTEANQIALGNNQHNNHSSSELFSLFENIHLKQTPSVTKPSYFYPINQTTPTAIFPINNQNIDIKEEKLKLWEAFLEGLKDIPTSHRSNLLVWLDHFDTALQCFTSQLPSEFAEDISLYDHYKTITAIAIALAYPNEKKEILLIQGDFFGIQNFIFSGGSQTNKNSAKLLRGRSFQVSLFTELAALKLLEACNLPSTSQIMNAAGKFLIIAPNNDFIHSQLTSVQKELNQWFITNTYGLAGIDIATQVVQNDQLSNGNKFNQLLNTLYEKLEETKLQRLYLTENEQTVLNVDYSKGICELNHYFPSVKNNRSSISNDQIKIGELLVKNDYIIVSDYDSEIYKNNQTQSLEMNIFGFGISFSEKDKDKKESASNFGKVTEYQQIHRFWDISIPQNLNKPNWNGYAKRYINAYIPKFKENGITDDNKYKNIEEENKNYNENQIKTFDYLACEDRKPDNNQNYIGQIALMTLKGDIDNLGTIFQKGLMKNNLAKTTALSRQMNFFFSLWLPAYCAENFPNTYTVFAGGDDFFLIGPWYSIQKLATDMQKEFTRYVAHNTDIHFSIGMVMTKVGIPIPRLGQQAEDALEKAKKVEGKNAVTIYQQSIKWADWHKLNELELEINRLANDYNISTSYLYSLIRLSKQAENTNNNIENTMWRSRFYYRTARYVLDKLPKEKKDLALTQIIKSFGDLGIEKYKGKFTIPLFNYFYQKREY
ncbi:CRISPR-associated protein Cas10/Csm1 (subtype III-A) [Bisgaardia hudsonensis]|uniref:CRISPR system single-strand-specific deoxyribonuclease Cas10/Csm1 (subtype III-A) n=1 Tax=Bisgaardia hudsonensis TaxID=109472 RepID=A0A4V2SJ67_9PAST|nr:type III-A CRISPR-associated protein Cas10/Csm1 [Bisgaardia hudsonensis]QLB13184.1 type III-A CRISPR-associated protein Cas10/Csm1 [Bisgaardia hudsonensis]TCP13241.1 CRISPR-associated protein Cas10/Csm1 (subtype III-A) [Bisgaardia hudsonensis]